LAGTNHLVNLACSRFIRGDVQGLIRVRWSRPECHPLRGSSSVSAFPQLSLRFAQGKHCGLRCVVPPGLRSATKSVSCSLAGLVPIHGKGVTRGSTSTPGPGKWSDLPIACASPAMPESRFMSDGFDMGLKSCTLTLNSNPELFEQKNEVTRRTRRENAVSGIVTEYGIT
jgi:hypothetical protein